MPYLSVRNPATFQGAASPWAIALASHTANALVQSRSHAPFFTDFLPTRRGIVVTPVIEKDRVLVLALYGAKMSNGKLDRFAAEASCGLIDELVGSWRMFSRAFVVFEINAKKTPALNVLDHDGTVRSVEDLSLFFNVDVPTLGDVDEALGTSLLDEREAWCAHLDGIHQKVASVPVGGAVA